MEDHEELAVIKPPKGRKKTLKSNEATVEVVPKARQGKCVGAPLSMMPSPAVSLSVSDVKSEELQTYRHVHYDTWMHIGNFIAPEAVQTFALICRQTAAVVNTKKFWMNQYVRHCQRPWSDGLEAESKENLRYRVIQLLFNRYPPLMNRVVAGYDIDILLGRLYVQCWHKKLSNLWIIVYTFTSERIQPLTFHDEECDRILMVPDNWEQLEHLKPRLDRPQYERYYLLIVHSNKFAPLPVLLEPEIQRETSRLVAVRQLLSNDMRCTNLELDFKSNHVITTVRHMEIKNVKAIPWWHPKIGLYCIGQTPNATALSGTD